MNSIMKRATSIVAATLVGFQLSAQSSTSASTDLILYALVGISVLMFAGVLFGLPSLKQLMGVKVPSFANGKVVKLTEGHDILLEGEADKAVVAADKVTRYAVQPPNFLGLQPIPKVTVAIGDSVKAGDQLFFDKQMADIKFVAPVSGEIIEINRGAKRAITEVVILADKTQQYKSFQAPSANASREQLVDFMKDSGAWTLLRQRPYNIIPSTDQTPRDIFVSTFDTAPLAPNSNVVVSGQEAAFQKGIDVLAKLTTGKVYLGLDGREEQPAAAFANAQNAECTYFVGKHPAGNVGVQIHHTAPVGGEDMVWTLGVQEVITLGKLFIDGRFDASRVVALAGAELNKPTHVRTYAGANVGELVAGNLNNDHVRLISGDVLSGEKKDSNAYLNWYDDQVTVVAEGDYYDMFGWLVPSEARPTLSGSYLSALNKNRKYKADTNSHGEKRAFVATTDYDKVMPMDIYVQHLMKSIIVNDFERMDGLGLKELVEEDVALCEFACVSKQPLQSILREGLETMREQS